MASQKDIQNALRNELKKEAGLQVKNNARYMNYDKTNVKFYNMDLNTAVLKLQVIKGGYPLKISQYNTYSFLYLETQDKETSELLNMEYVDAHNGVLAVTIPNDFLRNATDQTVNGQLYISTNKKNATPSEKSDTVSLNKFSFKVKDALINKMSGEIKTETLKMFYEISEEVKQKVSDMEEDIGKIGDLKDEIETTAQYAIQNISNDLKQARQQIGQDKDNAISSIEEERTKSLDNISKESDKINATITEFNDNLDQRFENYESKISDLSDEYKKNMESLDAVTHDEVEDWQKYKLTEKNGQRIRISGIDPVELNSGFYQMWFMKNAPTGSDDNSQYWNIDVTQGRDDTKQILATLSSNGETYKKNVHKGEDNGWKELTRTNGDTGWQPIIIKNDYVKSGIPDFDPSYRVIEHDTYREVFVRFGFEKLTKGKNVVGEIPNDLVPYKIYRNGTTTITKIPPKIVIPTNGDVEIHQYTSDEYIETDYVIYQGSWIIDKN